MVLTTFFMVDSLAEAVYTTQYSHTKTWCRVNSISAAHHFRYPRQCKSGAIRRQEYLESGLFNLDIVHLI